MSAEPVSQCKPEVASVVALAEDGFVVGGFAVEGLYRVKFSNVHFLLEVGYVQ